MNSDARDKLEISESHASMIMGLRSSLEYSPRLKEEFGKGVKFWYVYIAWAVYGPAPAVLNR